MKIYSQNTTLLIIKEMLNIKATIGRLLTIFSITATSLGLSAIIIVTSIINGFEAEIMRGILGIQGHFFIYNKQLQPIKKNQSMEIDQILQSIPEVTSHFPVIEQQTMAISRGKSLGLMLYGIKQDNLAQKNIINNNVIAGNLTNFKGKNIVIGASFANRFKLSINDNLTLMATQPSFSVFGGMPKAADFKVCAIFKTGLLEYDRSIIFMDINMAKKFFAQKGYNHIEGTLTDHNNTSKITENAQLRYKYYPLSWQETKGPLLNSFKIEKNAMAIILSIVIFIAIFNTIVLLYITIQNKRSSIAILKAMGVRNYKIIQSIIIIGSFIMIVGVLLGFILGNLFLNNADNIINFFEQSFGVILFKPETYGISKFPVLLDAMEVGKITIITVICSIIATIIPAIKAIRTQPATILRNE